MRREPTHLQILGRLLVLGRKFLRPSARVRQQIDALDSGHTKLARCQHDAGPGASSRAKNVTTLAFSALSIVLWNVRAVSALGGVSAACTRQARQRRPRETLAADAMSCVTRTQPTHLTFADENEPASAGGTTASSNADDALQRMVDTSTVRSASGADALLSA